MVKYLCIIQARANSNRLPSKVMLDLGGKTLLERVYDSVSKSNKIDDIIFDKIKERAEELGKIYRELKKDIDLTEKRLLCEIKSIQNSIGARVGVLEKYRHIILGSAIVLGLILSRNFPSILTLLMN